MTDGLVWQVQRGDGVTLGEPEILALTTPDEGLNNTVADLFTDPEADVVEALAGYGVQHVVLGPGRSHRHRGARLGRRPHARQHVRPRGLRLDRGHAGARRRDRR
ncbi:hypothetical protein [Nocardioides alcanivorans]|uniref:hypothetical protein n=1 Tax=Nocardioides alcanivorans TaxID=2897352 RepID=UPI001F2D1157|nr:hypothetical protein [Nocardioides alcanivorans]